MEADPSVYHLPASGREEITVFPGTLATTGDKMPTQHSVWEIASASSSFENPLFGRGPCTQEVAFAASGAGFHRQVLHLGQGWVPGWRARTNPVLALPWAVRLQDGLLSARKHPLDCYYDFFFFSLCTGFSCVPVLKVWASFWVSWLWDYWHSRSL